MRLGCGRHLSDYLDRPERAREDTLMDASERLMWEGLKRYCEFDRSDPFAFARGAAHIRQGLCGPCDGCSDMQWAWKNERGKSTGTKLGGQAGSEGHYDARRISLTQWGDVSRT